jgi:hypothetical protein
MEHEVPLALCALEQSFKGDFVSHLLPCSTTFTYLHVGSASGVLPVREALVIGLFVSPLPASAPAEGLFLCLHFKNHHALPRLTLIRTGREISTVRPW